MLKFRFLNKTQNGWFAAKLDWFWEKKNTICESNCNSLTLKSNNQACKNRYRFCREEFEKNYWTKNSRWGCSHFRFQSLFKCRKFVSRICATKKTRLNLGLQVGQPRWVIQLAKSACGHLFVLRYGEFSHKPKGSFWPAVSCRFYYGTIERNFDISAEMCLSTFGNMGSLNCKIYLQQTVFRVNSDMAK